MKKIIFRSFLTIFGIGLFACSSSKFDYQSAYKFSHYNYQKPTPIDLNQSENAPVQALASADPDFGPVPVSRPRIDFVKAENEPVNNVDVSNKSSFSELTREEKKAFKQDIKRQLKKISQERKLAKKEAGKKAAQMNRKIYTGLIIAGAGIVVAILASGTVGGLAIIVGVALIAWGLIEQGSF
ncbi:hypothetical protein QQ020_17800 [Fulvivirgaceae bacterium BMA12]|uniref:Lipoprotein n=1 Tax=Agaribacillus aureus TaxID=3051825 RepID=A0ABT8L845_9BACT|nr:hypothetical protein [Fulvivirgaceae bacterium BMA12]